MRIETFDYVPKCARDIREEVFLREQGFEKEYDELDETTTHFVAFDDSEKALGTCRLIDNSDGSYTVGRFAVLKEYRGQGIGRYILSGVEKYVEKIGGRSVMLHAQCQAAEFYEKCGYEKYGDIEYEQGCPHISMKKMVTGSREE